MTDNTADWSLKILLPEGETKMSSKAANMFAPCPGSPNCVYSLAENKKNFVEPIPYHGEKAVAQYELLEILHSVSISI
jgi:uncharacterized protein (DUF1499 family)